MRPVSPLLGRSFQVLTLIGNAYFATNKIDSAIVFYNKGFELEESNEIGFYIKEDYYNLYFEGDHDAYIKNLSENIKKSPDIYGLYMYRGELRAMRNDFVGALEDFRIAATLQPTTHNWINKAEMEWKVGSRDQAKKDFASAMTININEAYNIYGSTRQNKKLRDYLFEHIIETTKQLINEHKK